MTDHGSRDGGPTGLRSPWAWLRRRIGTARSSADDAVPVELDRGFDLDHWLAATGGIPAGLVDRTHRRPTKHPTLRSRSVMSMTIALLIVSAGFIAAANISMPTGAVGESNDPAAAVPTTTAESAGGSDGGSADTAPSSTSTSTATPASTSTDTPTATATPTATSTESDTVDELVETVDDTVDDTEDTVDDTEDSVNETVDSTL